jgi:hypothetical protein
MDVPLSGDIWTGMGMTISIDTQRTSLPSTENYINFHFR